MDPSEGLERARRRDGHLGRFEAAEIEFHRRVRAAYLEIARRDPRRVRVLAADIAPERVFEQTWRALTDRFGR
jgi:dTMP kinase